MRAPIVLVLAGAAALVASETRADWQYVRWGMTPAQAIAASKGEARPSSATGNEVCAFKDQRSVAYIPAKVIDSHTYDVNICVGTDGRVSSVVLSPKPIGGSYNRLRAALLGRYGQPIEDGRGDYATVTWRDAKGGNLVRLLRFVDSARLEYRKAGSGL